MKSVKKSWIFSNQWTFNDGIQKSVWITELIERVLFRFGTADTDDQLEATVIKFLTPVLLKITSPNETVRCKVCLESNGKRKNMPNTNYLFERNWILSGIQVMEVLTHLNKRLKTRPMVQMPVEALLQQYQTTDSTFLHNFSIIYITMGFPRLTQDLRTSLVPLLLNCLEGKPENHQDKWVWWRCIIFDDVSYLREIGITIISLGYWCWCCHCWNQSNSQKIQRNAALCLDWVINRQRENNF